MRKRLALLLVGVMTLTMAYGVIGSGASFTATKFAEQTINVGRMTLQISSSTNGAHFAGDTLVCPAVKVLKSTDMDPVGCQITIDSVGDITPGEVTMTASAVTDGADMTKFNIQQFGTGWDNGLGGAYASINGPVDTTSVFPSSAVAQVYWTGLTNADQGMTVVVTYKFAAVE